MQKNFLSVLFLFFSLPPKRICDVSYSLGCSICIHYGGTQEYSVFLGDCTLWKVCFSLRCIGRNVLCITTDKLYAARCKLRQRGPSTIRAVAPQVIWLCAEQDSYILYRGRRKLLNYFHHVSSSWSRGLKWHNVIASVSWYSLNVTKTTLEICFHHLRICSCY